MLAQNSGRVGVRRGSGEATDRLVKTDSLIVLGNLSLPIVDGRIPLYHPERTNQIVGYLEVKPINE